ncbi:MAG: hypothetical protein HQL20_03260 [Candidatus Omnitrophica bacterium]|nr:hypothetical protein [Candidatus Omnitrophota bacterium]
MLKACHCRNAIIVSLALLIGAGPSGTALAQAYTAQISFLENYASSLYARGDHAAARKEFERIARMDPRNATAAKFLALLNNQAAVKTAEPTAQIHNLDSALSDLSTLKANISRYEAGSQDLEYLIRNLITENDSLYSMLYLRSRELGELRAKFYGTPYAGPFDNLMKSLPPDRVPQHLHQSNELLKLVREQSALPSVSPAKTSSKLSSSKPKPATHVTSAPILVTPTVPVTAEVTPATPATAAVPVTAAVQADEVQALVQSIIAQRKMLAPNQKNSELSAAITEKRTMLVDKTLAVLDKNENLTALKNRLAEMNTTLKAIDAYYQAIKSEISARNFTEQKQFSDLMIDYAAKLKEIETLKARVNINDANLAPAKEQLARLMKSIDEINATLSAKDRQIAEFKSLLAEKTAIITQQKADLTFTDDALGKARNQLTSIEDLLKDNDAGLAELQAGVAQMRTLVQAKPPAPPIVYELPNAATVPPVVPPADKTAELKELLAQKDVQLAELKTSHAAITAQLAETRAKSTDAQTIIAALKDENTVLKTANSEREAFCTALNARLAELAANAQDKNATVLSQKETLASLAARLQSLEAQLQTTRADLSDKNQELRKAQSQARSLETELSKSESSAQRSKEAYLDQKETSEVKTTEIARLRTEIELLSAETEKLRGKSIIVTSNQPLNPAPVTVSAPVNTEEARILHATLLKKDNEITSLKQKLFELSAATRENITEKTIESKTAVRSYSLDLQEKNTQIKALQALIDEKARIIRQADEQSQLLQEKLSIMEAKQDAIKGVVQKRDMEFMRAEASAEATAKDLARTIGERDSLKKLLADQESAAALAESRLLLREDEIAKLNEEIRALHATANNAHNEIARLNQELKTLRGR